MRIAPDEFDALMALLHSDPTSAINIAARAVLVDGKRQADAMRAAGVSRSAVCDNVKRFRDADALIRRAYGIQAGRGTEPISMKKRWAVVRFPNGAWECVDNPHDPEYATCEMWDISASSREKAISNAQVKRSRARK